MSVVPALRQELVDAARRSARASRQTRRRVPLLVAAVLLTATLAAAALAATGVIGSGEPLKPSPGTPHNPHEGLGVPRPGTGAMLPIAVADPDGGPAWGARFVTTTRGLGCLQIGRVVDGRLGVLGQDGAFANDHRFHPLTLSYFGSGGAFGPFPCGTLDSHGHAFAHMYMHGVPASGLVVPSRTQMGCRAGRAYRHRGVTIPRCPDSDWRQITTGMAGPQAVSVTYRTRRGRRTVRTVGDQGAYLIVQRVSARSRSLGSYAPWGAGPLVRITYKDGSSCTVRRYRQVNDTCPPVGRVLPAEPVTAADVRAPVTARIGKGHYGRTVVVSFIARRAVTDASSAYVVTIEFSGPQVNCRSIVVGPALRNVKVGERVSFHQPTSGCRGVFHGKIEYGYGLPGGVLPAVGAGGKSLLVGRFTVDGR